MEITINDQPIDVTLEHEKTLGEVVKGLEEWLESNNLVVFSAHADGGGRKAGQDLFSTRDWEQLSIEGIDLLRLTVTHADELLKANLHTVEEFLALLGAALSGADEAGIAGLIEGLPYLKESVQRQLSPDLSSDLERLTDLLKQANAATVAAWPPHVRAEAQRLIALLRERTAYRRRELEEPGSVLAEMASELERCSEEIGDVSILMQTGRDREAMDAVIRFSDLSGRLARLIAYTRGRAGAGRPAGPEGDRLRSFYTDLNTVLAELVEAFRSRDSVLIGDLLEYEIAPRLKTLKKMVGELL